MTSRNLEALVFSEGHDFFVSFSIAGEEVDLAGPFDDQLDAELAAQRHARSFLAWDETPMRPIATWAGGSFLNAAEKRRRAA